jgi:glutaredoxin
MRIACKFFDICAPGNGKEGGKVTLFTKEGCEKCEYVKKSADLKKLGITVEVLSPDNPDSLAHLAWHELVSLAETQLPILVLDDSSSITGAIRIKNYLAAISHQPSAISHQHHR